MTTELLSFDEAAAIVRLAPSSLKSRGLRKKFNLPTVRIGNRVFFRLSDLEAFIASRVEEPGAKLSGYRGPFVEGEKFMG